MADTKTPTPRSDVTLADAPGPSVVPDPMPPVAPRPGFPLGLRDLLTSIFTDGPTWAKIVVAVALILAGAFGHKCVERAPAPVLPAPVNVQPTPVNVSVLPAQAFLEKWKATKEPFAVTYCCREEGQCCPTVCTCDPERCKCADCKSRVAAATDPAVKSKLTPRQRLFADRVRHRLSERLQRDGYALVGGDATPLTQEQAAAAVARLSDGQVFGAAYSAGAWAQIGDDGGGGLLGFIQRIVQWIADHPEVVQAILKILMSLLMFI
ncbi:hypothetical protein [Gemmata sp.]|uniref:hypothetical protein n=1 Tax=Gemmata sp. TaxID=1914242 RepID=UPI003F711EBA